MRSRELRHGGFNAAPPVLRPLLRPQRLRPRKLERRARGGTHLMLLGQQDDLDFRSAQIDTKVHDDPELAAKIAGLLSRWRRSALRPGGEIPSVSCPWSADSE